MSVISENSKTKTLTILFSRDRLTTSFSKWFENTWTDIKMIRKPAFMSQFKK